MSLTPDLRDELRELVKAVRAHLELEQACASPGVQLPGAAREPQSGVVAKAPAATPEAALAAISGRAMAVAGAVSTDREAPEARSPGASPDALGARSASPSPDGGSSPPGLDSPGGGSSPGALEPRGGPALELPSPPMAALSLEDKRRKLEVLAGEAAACSACVLHEKRTQAVFARGTPMAQVAFVGEGPGRDEDLQGFPFVGAAGKLLDRMIVAMGYGRDDVYVCNVVKCRPPENRTPRPEESLACARYLVPQLETVAPTLIVALGRCAAQALGVADVTGPWRGRWGQWRGIPVMPTYHPAFLLRSPEFKRTVWEDLQLVMGRLGRSPKRPDA